MVDPLSISRILVPQKRHVFLSMYFYLYVSTPSSISPSLELGREEARAAQRPSIMDQISIKKPNPKCRLFLKIDQ